MVNKSDMAAEDIKKLESSIKDAIKETKAQIAVAEKEDEKVNELKIVTYWEVGERINGLTDKMTPRDKKAILDRFATATDMSKSFFYLSVKFHSVFTKEQYKKAVANGMRVRVMKALVGDKNIDDKRRAQLIQQAITKGLTEDDIRVIRGTKGARRAATAQQREVKAKKHPPKRIFSTTLDRALLLEESVGFATNAIGRMADMKDTDLEETTKTLIQLRDKINEVNQTVDNFLKFTNNFSKRKKGGE